ncbi:DNA-binding response OmpR family regulator [Salirhabdus euzebyi]|uniref:DNA-binding response OmpR family regulator n=1 Tax=Salirhabdus euzebyi TaxID=394506 RepID=A0A841Q6K7_9BACI|nr:response regulator transcription factor [Salirhabdus euzebyi]MBB6454046.1 DNA-binding response OmpR family regulator [Salirhabdus euzebyi]
MAKILIVEDEQKLARVIQLELEYEGYKTGIAHDGKLATELISEQSWDLVLLDILLPKLSGLEVLRRVRKDGVAIPIILLTARDEVHDKVSGLDLGANDYITKPFQIEELLARIRAHLRQNPVHLDVISFGELSVNLQTRQVKRKDTTIELTPREFDLLVYLVRNQNQVLTREQIMNQVWGYDYIGETNVVDVYIRYLRQKLDKPFDNSYVQTIRGIGYSIRENEL